MPFYLAFKEIWHNKGRFLLIALIVALITTLVLFIAALAEGLGNGNREYLQKLNGELVVYQENVDLSISSSRIGRSTLNAIRRVPGVASAGQVGFSLASILYGPATGAERSQLDIALIGVEPGAPGAPPVLEGRELNRNRAEEVVIDRNVTARTGIQIGDVITLRVVQGTKEELYDLTVVGVTDGRQYFIRPGIFVPYLTYDKVRPQGENEGGRGELVSNIVAVKLQEPSDWQGMAARIEGAVGRVEVVDRTTAYEATPGYTAQQSTLDTQRYFTFFIGVLVIGGFFQIQTLQKVAQIGMLKAIGASNATVAGAALAQIVTVNAFGVLVGTLGSLGLGLALPPVVPAIFTGEAVLAAIASLLVIGPLGGLVSVWLLLRVEPLIALGLGQ
jgi:putative ABC transport system permease protein